MKAAEITNKIIAKGGLIGQCVDSWRKNNGDTNVLFKECSEIALTPFASEVWGEELINTILKYSKKEPPRHKKIGKLDGKILHTIIELRESKGLLQKEIAIAMKTSVSNYCKIENGFRPFSVEQLEIISNALGLTIFDILLLAKKRQD